MKRSDTDVIFGHIMMLILNTFFITAISLLAHTKISLALSLPLSSSTPASSSTAFTADKTGVQCFEAKVFDSRLADTKSCLQAILKLPESSDPGDFHNGGSRSDVYKLPVIRTDGPCMATVSVQGSAQERSSWDHIKSVATAVAAICSIGQYPLGSTGGVTYVGPYRSIRVTIERFSMSGLSEGGFQNDTATV